MLGATGVLLLCVVLGGPAAYLIYRVGCYLGYRVGEALDQRQVRKLEEGLRKHVERKRELELQVLEEKLRNEILQKL